MTQPYLCWVAHHHMSAVRPHFILCFDFDGTLVHPEQRPSFHPLLGEMIRQLRDQGALWVINTGRSLPQTLEGLTEHGIFMLPDYIVAQECYLHRAEAEGTWSEVNPWNQSARRAHASFVRKHQPVLAEIGNFVHSATRAEMVEGHHGEVGIVAKSSEEMQTICEHIDRLHLQWPELGYHRNSVYLRFSHSQYGKGPALAELQRLLGIGPNRCFAAGDNYNDLSMLLASRARMIAAPGNALNTVKRQVLDQGGYVALGEAAEGMMQALEHYFNLGRSQPARTA